MVISITVQPGDSEDQPQLATEEQGERWAQTVAVSLCARLVSGSWHKLVF